MIPTEVTGKLPRLQTLPPVCFSRTRHSENSVCLALLSFQLGTASFLWETAGIKIGVLDNI